MSWVQRLYETYERCYGAAQFEKNPLNPVSSQFQDTQIQITLDAEGTFRRAEVHELRDTLIAVSEDSAARSGSDPCPNPLTDKLGYCAGDIAKYGGDDRRFDGYLRQLTGWCGSEHADPKAGAVLLYVAKKTLIGDLIREKVLAYESGKLARLRISPKKIVEAKDAWIRWRVEIPGNLEANTWEDLRLFQRWAAYENSGEHPQGICMVTGESVRTAQKHPRGIRSNSDRAKLITSNDLDGFTFRGRFTQGKHAAGLGYEVTQKAHNALRWLIKRQGARTGDQVLVAWDVGGADTPDLQKSTTDWLGLDDESKQDDIYSGDAGQLLALRLRKKLQGYRASLGDTSGIVVMGVDTAAEKTGRLAITFYRELTGSEFLDRIEQWHTRNAWYQALPKENSEDRRTNARCRYYIGAPSPTSIAMAAYGSGVERDGGMRLLRATIERLLPCIVEGRGIPRDIANSCVRRCVNRLGFKKEAGIENEWEQCLGVACALVRGSRKEENYQMSLEEDRKSRDYLFGRLLAIADNIEQRALYLADEKRDTNAARLLQRFADHPCSTWRIIEGKLIPYRTRLRANRPGELVKRDKLLDAVMDMFSGDGFTSDRKLSGEFLLGYHCQRAALWRKENADGESPEHDESESEGEEHEHSSEQD